MAAVKKAMIKYKLITVKSTQLNELLKKHNDETTYLANPLYWGNTGHPSIIPVSILKDKFLEQQAQQTNKIWEEKDTREVLEKAVREQAAANNVAIVSIKLPCSKTVKIYHNSLMSDPDIVRRNSVCALGAKYVNRCSWFTFYIGCGRR